MKCNVPMFPYDMKMWIFTRKNMALKMVGTFTLILRINKMYWIFLLKLQKKLSDNVSSSRIPKVLFLNFRFMIEIYEQDSRSSYFLTYEETIKPSAKLQQGISG